MSDDAIVEEWRLSEFERMGFKMPAAALLNDWQVDLHQAQDLISAGCPHELALRILRPLDDRVPYSAGVVKRVAEYSVR